MLIKERIKRNFSKSAAEYDKYSHLQQGVALLLKGMIPPENYEKILDIGAGTGYLSKVIAKAYPSAKVIGIDLAPGMVEYARAGNPFPNLSFQEGDGEALQFNDGSFDLVISSSAFQWMDPRLSFSEIRRILRPRGKFYFSLFGAATLKELKYLLNKDVYGDSYSKDKIKELLGVLGFGGVRVNTIKRQENFADFFELIRFLKDLGAQASQASLGFSSRSVLAGLAKQYLTSFRAGDGVAATFEVLLGRGHL